MYFNFFFSWRASSFKTTGKVHVFTIGYFLLGFIYFVRLKNWYWTICWISDIFLLVLQRVHKNFILDQTEIQTADSWGINPSPRGLNLPWTKKKHASLYSVTWSYCWDESDKWRQCYAMSEILFNDRHSHLLSARQHCRKKYELRNKNFQIIIIISRWDHASEQFLSGFPMNIPLTQSKK